MRRTFTAPLLLAAALFWSACGGGSDAGANAGRDEVDTTVNSERIESSNIAPTGGPGAEPENSGKQSSGNADASKNANEGNTGDKKQPDSKNKNSQ
ncbi:MAG TPA: hypothetical protein VN256_17230 [Pyrinomonadaceae bacterium]|nr:hypothetical protein [Pyrinomonadaceae bacterium]